MHRKLKFSLYKNRDTRAQREVTGLRFLKPLSRSLRLNCRLELNFRTEREKYIFVKNTLFHPKNISVMFISVYKFIFRTQISSFSQKIWCKIEASLLHSNKLFFRLEKDMRFLDIKFFDCRINIAENITHIF